MPSVEINTLPTVQELFEDDFVLVQSKSRTALIKFEDFVIGEQQVSFYKEIVDNRNSLTELITRVDEIEAVVQSNTTAGEENTEIVNENKQLIQDQQSTNTEMQSKLDTLQNRVDAHDLELESQAQSVLQVEQTASESPSIVLSAKLAETQQQLEAVNSIIESLQTEVQNLNGELQTLKNTDNVINTQLYTHGARLTTLEG